MAKAPSPVPAPTKIDLVFFRQKGGSEPVRDWLTGLPQDNRRAIGQDLMRVQYGWPVGMPLVRPMGKGLFEVRTDLPDGTIARVLFCFAKGELYALHGFIKKAKKTPPQDLALGTQTAEGDWTMTETNHRGSTLDSFLEEEGVLEEFQAKAIKTAIAWQLTEAMKERKLSKTRLAAMMHTSRTQVDRVLDPNNGNVTLETLQRAAAVVGRRVQVELV